MICFADYTPDGRVQRSGVAGAEGALLPLDTGCKRAFTDDLFEPTSSYWNGSTVVRQPPSPSPHHTFDYAIKGWVFDPDKAWAWVRSRRDQMLAASDWVVLRASDRGEPVPPEWLAYRQALRDVTEQADPASIIWPEIPVS